MKEPLASKRATEKAKKQKVEQDKVAEFQKAEKGKNPAFRLATFEDLQGDYRTALVETPLGRGFEIQSIDAGGITQIAGQPFIKLMTLSGMDFNAEKPLMDQLMAIPEEDQQKIVESDEYDHYLNAIVCAGVISVQLVDKKPQDLTEREIKEKKVSVYRLPYSERQFLFEQIMTLSLDEAYLDAFTQFRPADNQADEQTVDSAVTPDM